MDTLGFFLRFLVEIDGDCGVHDNLDDLIYRIHLFDERTVGHDDFRTQDPGEFGSSKNSTNHLPGLIVWVSCFNNGGFRFIRAIRNTEKEPTTTLVYVG